MSTPHPAGAAGFWTLDRVADALGPLLVAARPRGARPLHAVCTDTRALVQGDVFVALRGESHDAHDYLAQAVASGAAALVVSRLEPARALGVPVYHVRDTLTALGQLGRYRRRAWNGPVIAIAGSNGKTTTKELVRAALGGTLEVHATTGNLNNQVGVPLTLLAIPDGADVAVVEIGTNSPGEVALLRALAEPSVAVVTSVGEEHLEGLGDLAGVLREESAVFDGVPIAIVPSSQPEIGDAALARGARVVRAGLESGDVRADRWSVTPEGLGRIEMGAIVVAPPLRGAHNLRNTMLALATAAECGVSMDAAARGIAAMPVPSMRTTWQSVGRATLVNDAYNSNPASARAAIELLDGAGAARQRVLVLGTMRELGAQSARLHDDIARAALASRADIVAGVGEFADALRRAGAGESRVVAAADVEALWPVLAPRVAPDALIVLKASRGVRLERLVPFIEAWARGAESSPATSHH